MSSLDHATDAVDSQPAEHGKRGRFRSLIDAIRRVFSRSRERKPVAHPMSPGAALDGWKMSEEDAAMLRRAADPNNPAGKARLRAGPAIQR
jgi:hypothetical protein